MIPSKWGIETQTETCRHICPILIRTALGKAHGYPDPTEMAQAMHNRLEFQSQSHLHDPGIVRACHFSITDVVGSVAGCTRSSQPAAEQAD